MSTEARQGIRNPFVFPLRHSAVIPADRVWVATVLSMTWDAVCVLTCGCLCAIIYNAFFLSSEVAPGSGHELVVAAVRTSLEGGLLAPLILGRMPTQLTEFGRPAMLRQACLRMIVLFGVVLTIGFLSRTVIYLPRLWMLAWLATTLCCVVSGRLLLLLCIRGAAGQRLLQERVAIVGEPSSVAKIATRLRHSQGARIEIITWDDNHHSADRRETGVSEQSIARLVECGKRCPLDRVVIVTPHGNYDDLASIVNQLKALSVDIVLCPDLFGDDRYVMQLVQLAGMPMSVLARRPIRQWGWVLKMLEDKILAMLLVAWLLPLMSLIAIAIRLDSPGPVLFRQRRYGINNTEFDIIKFRTMVWAGSPAGRVEQTIRDDQRVTRVGRFLRQSSLDELPQLFNVLRGDMSLVGPRPHPTAMRTENLLGEQIMADYSHRHRVKPGMTGWAQVNGFRGATHTTEEVRQRVEHDNWYIDNWSVLFDLKILALTPLRLILDRKRAY